MNFQSFANEGTITESLVSPILAFFFPFFLLSSRGKSSQPKGEIFLEPFKREIRRVFIAGDDIFPSPTALRNFRARPRHLGIYSRPSRIPRYGCAI